MLAARSEQAMRRRQMVAGHTHEQMMLAVIIDPIRRNRKASDKAGISGPSANALRHRRCDKIGHFCLRLARLTETENRPIMQHPRMLDKLHRRQLGL